MDKYRFFPPSGYVCVWLDDRPCWSWCYTVHNCMVESCVSLKDLFSFLWRHLFSKPRILCYTAFLYREENANSWCEYPCEQKSGQFFSQPRVVDHFHMEPRLSELLPSLTSPSCKFDKWPMLRFLSVQNIQIWRRSSHSNWSPRPFFPRLSQECDVHNELRPPLLHPCSDSGARMEKEHRLFHPQLEHLILLMASVEGISEAGLLFQAWFRGWTIKISFRYNCCRRLIFRDAALPSKIKFDDINENERNVSVRGKHWGLENNFYTIFFTKPTI